MYRRLHCASWPRLLHSVKVALKRCGRFSSDISYTNISRQSRVWCNFTVASKSGDLKLRIQDAPKDRLDDVANLYADYFAPEEDFHRTIFNSMS